MVTTTGNISAGSVTTSTIDTSSGNLSINPAGTDVNFNSKSLTDVGEITATTASVGTLDNDGSDVTVDDNLALGSNTVTTTGNISAGSVTTSTIQNTDGVIVDYDTDGSIIGSGTDEGFEIQQDGSSVLRIDKDAIEISGRPLQGTGSLTITHCDASGNSLTLDAGLNQNTLNFSNLPTAATPSNYNIVLVDSSGNLVARSTSTADEIGATSGTSTGDIIFNYDTDDSNDNVFAVQTGSSATPVVQANNTDVSVLNRPLNVNANDINGVNNIDAGSASNAVNVRNNSETSILTIDGATPAIDANSNPINNVSTLTATTVNTDNLGADTTSNVSMNTALELAGNAIQSATADSALTITQDSNSSDGTAEHLTLETLDSSTNNAVGNIILSADSGNVSAADIVFNTSTAERARINASGLHVDNLTDNGSGVVTIGNTLGVNGNDISGVSNIDANASTITLRDSVATNIARFTQSSGLQLYSASNAISTNSGNLSINPAGTDVNFNSKNLTNVGEITATTASVGTLDNDFSNIDVASSLDMQENNIRHLFALNRRMAQFRYRVIDTLQISTTASMQALVVDSPTGRVYVADSNGDIHEINQPDQLNKSSFTTVHVAPNSIQDMLQANGLFYVCDDNGSIYEVDFDAATIQSRTVASGVTLHSLAIDIDDFLYIGDANGDVHQINVGSFETDTIQKRNVASTINAVTVGPQFLYAGDGAGDIHQIETSAFSTDTISTLNVSSNAISALALGSEYLYAGAGGSAFRIDVASSFDSSTIIENSTLLSSITAVDVGDAFAYFVGDFSGAGRIDFNGVDDTIFDNTLGDFNDVVFSDFGAAFSRSLTYAANSQGKVVRMVDYAPIIGAVIQAEEGIDAEDTNITDVRSIDGGGDAVIVNDDLNMRFNSLNTVGGVNEGVVSFDFNWTAAEINVTSNIINAVSSTSNEVYAVDNNGDVHEVTVPPDFDNASVTTLTVASGTSLNTIDTSSGYLFIGDNAGDLHRITVSSPFGNSTIETISLTTSVAINTVIFEDENDLVYACDADGDVYEIAPASTFSNSTVETLTVASGVSLNGIGIKSLSSFGDVLLCVGDGNGDVHVIDPASTFSNSSVSTLNVTSSAIEDVNSDNTFVYVVDNNGSIFIIPANVTPLADSTPLSTTVSGRFSLANDGGFVYAGGTGGDVNRYEFDFQGVVTSRVSSIPSSVDVNAVTVSSGDLFVGDANGNVTKFVNFAPSTGEVLRTPLGIDMQGGSIKDINSIDGGGNAIDVFDDLDMNGNTVTNESSRYIKRDIQRGGNAANRLLDLNPVSFRYQQGYGDNGASYHHGVIAEEVARILPDVVACKDDGTVYGIRYMEMIPLLLQVLQNQQKTIQEQQAYIYHQEQELSLQQRQIQDIYRRIGCEVSCR